MRSTLSDAQTLFVSFSGGADSLALLLFAWKNYPQKVTAVHFEHGFRGEESLRDAEFCRKTCETWGIPFRLIPLDVPHHKKNGEGDEEAARRLRLEAWQKIVTDPAHSAVLLGHHADDAVETLLLRLFRGSNASGLAALRENRVIHGITFLRPQLGMTRADIETFLAENGITNWCEDSTNSESLYLRNFLRNDFLPALSEHAPYARGGMIRSLQSLEDDAALLEQLADEAYTHCKQNVDHWSSLPPALLVRVLRRFLGGTVLSHQALTRFQEEMRKPYTHPVRIDLGQGIMLKRTKRALTRLPDTPEAEIRWRWKEDPVCRGLHAELHPRAEVGDLTDGAACFDAARMPEELILAPWQPGEKILSFDGKLKSLKKLFCDCHISGADRRVLKGEDGTIYMAIGVRNSAVAKVTEETETVLRITGSFEDGTPVLS